jgi:ribosome recycling factor
MNDESLVQLAIEDTREKMAKVIEHTRGEFSSIRTGRATPVLVEKLRVDYYGSDVPLQQIAGFSVPEARTLVIKPYDVGSITAIEKAIQASDLGVNPSNDGQVLRIIFPQLNEERRKELVKSVRNRAEEGRVGIRNVRRATRQDLEALEKDKDMSSDDLERAEKELDAVTEEFVSEVNRMLAHKEHELLEV